MARICVLATHVRTTSSQLDRFIAAGLGAFFEHAGIGRVTINLQDDIEALERRVTKLPPLPNFEAIASHRRARPAKQSVIAGLSP